MPNATAIIMSTVSAIHPTAEAEAFLAAHPDLYARDGKQGPACDPRRRSPDGIADLARVCQRRVHPLWSAMSPLGQPKTRNPAGASHMTTQRLGLIMNGVTGRMGLNQHLIRSIIAIRDQGGVLLVQWRPRDAGSDPGRPRRRQGRAPGQAVQRAALDHRSRQGAGATRTTPSSSTPRPRRRGRRC